MKSSSSSASACRPRIVATLVFACVLSACHSGRSKHQAPPATEIPAPHIVDTEADRVAPPRAAAASPATSSVEPTPRSASPVASTVASDPTIDPVASARPAAAPLEQTVRIKVNVDETKTITQPVALDVKLAKQPQLEVPLALNVTMPSDAERKIPVVFTVDSSAPLVVPIRFQAEGGGIVGVQSSTGGNPPAPGGSGGPFVTTTNSPPANVNGSVAFDAARIPMALLAGIVGGAGLVGGLVRSLEARRVMKRRVARLASSEGSRLTFEERVRSLDQQSHSLNAGDQFLMFFANVIWGVLAAALVPACLVVRENPLLMQIEGSRAHVLALFGFCLLAATVGAELLVLAQRLLQRAMDGGDRIQPTGTGGTPSPFSEELGKPRPAPSE